MADVFAETFDHIIALCRSAFQNLVILRYQKRPNYAVLELRAEYPPYLIQIREILRIDASRKYSYYAIRENQVAAGFDNASDPDALRLKYGAEYTQHRLELIPHYHSQNKETIELTAEMDCQMFIEWLQQNL